MENEISIVEPGQVQAGDMVFIPSVAYDLNGQIMLRLPHVDGVPDRMMALHPEWFGHATRALTPAPMMMARELIRDALSRFVAPDVLEGAVEVMYRTIAKHIEDEPVPAQAGVSDA